MASSSFQGSQIISNVGVLSTLAAGLSSSSSDLALELIQGQDVLKLSFPVVASALARKMIGGNNSKLAKVVPFIILISGTYGFLRATPITKVVSAKIKDHFHAEIMVPGSDSLNTDVLAWLATQGLGAKATSLVVDADQDAKSITYVPHTGTFTFYFEGTKLTMQKQPVEVRVVSTPQRGGYGAPPPQHDDGADKKADILISCWTMTGYPIQKIKAFLSSVRGFAEAKKDKTTTVWKAAIKMQPTWSSTLQPSRTMDSVALKSDLKQALIKDVSRFLAPGAEKWHVSRGQPYRRGYLLYGPPGTGKTSCARALAGQYELPLFLVTLSMPGLNDSVLEDFFSRIPRRAVVLLEDVDCAGLSREPTPLTLDKRGRPKNALGPTLSGLLNVIDGPASRDGRILLLTTNNPDALDAALIRPGRCDKKILFGYACADVCAQLFSHVYTPTAEELADGAVDEFRALDVPRLAQRFGAAVPQDVITPAEANSYLLENRDDPVAAVRGAEAFFAQIAETKARGANVLAFANEISKAKAAVPGERQDSKAPVSAEEEEEGESEGEDEDEPESIMRNGVWGRRVSREGPVPGMRVCGFRAWEDEDEEGEEF